MLVMYLCVSGIRLWLCICVLGVSMLVMYLCARGIHVGHIFVCRDIHFGDVFVC
jgi:hypothetical protein